jgi:hypothetical protein
MLINVIVLGVTLLALSLMVAWLLIPGLRASIEAPKYDVASWDRKTD